MKNKIIQLTFAGGAALLMAGCISHEKTVYRDVERTRVAFENETAGRIFYEALSKPPRQQTHTESKTEVVVPVVFDHKHKVVSGPNIAFNQAVEQCDTNKDGTITEMEAKIFAEQRERKS